MTPAHEPGARPEAGVTQEAASAPGAAAGPLPARVPRSQRPCPSRSGLLQVKRPAQSPLPSPAAQQNACETQRGRRKKSQTTGCCQRMQQPAQSRNAPPAWGGQLLPPARDFLAAQVHGERRSAARGVRRNAAPAEPGAAAAVLSSNLLK